MNNLEINLRIVVGSVPCLLVCISDLVNINSIVFNASGGFSINIPRLGVQKDEMCLPTSTGYIFGITRGLKHESLVIGGTIAAIITDADGKRYTSNEIPCGEIANL